MGWVVLIALMAVSGIALWVFGLRGGMLQAAGAALLFGAAGYALQGRPDLRGAQASTAARQTPLPLTEARHAFYGNFSHAESWLRMSEALARDGRSEDSVGILQNAVRRYPGDAQLWVGLGNALVDQAQVMTPPAALAYRRAAELTPGYPGPSFFYGLALARSGDRQAAVAVWKQILATGPAHASWRPLVEQGVAALDARPNPASR